MDSYSSDNLNRATGELMNELSGKTNISEFLKENEKEFSTPNIGKMISGLLKEKNITKSSLASSSGMSEVYLYQILGGRRVPSRDRMICICLGLGCSLSETQNLLRQARFAELYPRVRREAIIIFAIKEKWDVNRLNDMLFEFEEETMF